MDNHDHTSGFVVFWKIFASWAGVLGAVTLQQWGAIVGIVAGLLAAGYTALQFYILWRDKIVNYRPVKRTRSTDFGELAGQSKEENS